MKTILAGDCDLDNIFQILDPTSFLEIDFEAEVVKALSCLLPEYMCGVFAGTFILEGERKSADLALIHRSLSHWFVVEVELAGHSLNGHVLPQVRCFRFGEPEATCITSLCRGFPLDRQQAEMLLKYVPRFVAVVANMHDPEWSASLQGLDTEMLTVSVYKDRNGRLAYELEGRLSVRRKSLGFGHFSAVHNSLRLPKSCGLPTGQLQIEDHFGVIAWWTTRESGDALWVTKDAGPALIPHESYVQVIQSFEGRISLRLSFSTTAN